VLEQPLTPRLQLGGGNTGAGLRLLVHVYLLVRGRVSPARAYRAQVAATAGHRPPPRGRWAGTELATPGAKAEAQIWARG
jgi:hypothetical protein